MINVAIKLFKKIYLFAHFYEYIRITFVQGWQWHMYIDFLFFTGNSILCS